MVYGMAPRAESLEIEVMKRLAFLVVLLGTVLSFAAGPAHKNAPSVEIALPATIADSLPWFAVREVKDGNAPFTKGHLAKFAAKCDRVALVYFATWCLPCREGVRILAKSKDQLAENKVGVVLVNIGEPDEKMIKSWVDKLGASGFTVVVDPFKRMTENFGMSKEGVTISLPRTLVVDTNVLPTFMLGQEGNDWPQVLWTK